MDPGAMSSARTTGQGELRVRWFTHVLAVVLGGVFGWDVGLKMGGSWVGLLMAANSAFFASLAAGAAVDLWVRLRNTADRRMRGNRQR